MSPRDFADPAALEAWLRRRNVPLETWGRDAAKGVADLWAEYAAGETALYSDPLHRRVTVVELLIRRGDRVLVELEQELADGRRRQRGLPPSEKLKDGESITAAAARCLAEELGLPASTLALREEPLPRERLVASPSYPGLPTRYVIHTVEATLNELFDAALPAGDFWMDNAAPDDPVRRHRWGWR